MNANQIVKTLCLLAFAWWCLSAIMPPSEKIILGPDLEGGAELVYSVPGSDQAVKTVAEVMQNRIDPTGAKGYLVSVNNDGHIRVQMSGVSRERLERVKALIARAGTLEFREVASRYHLSEIFQDALTLKREDPEAPAPRGWRWYLTQDGNQVLVSDQKEITGQMLQRADISHGEQGDQAVSLTFQGEGVDALKNLSSKLYKRDPQGRNGLMAIILDDVWQENEDGSRELITKGICNSAPVVNGVFTDGSCVISGGGSGFKPEEAKELRTVLNSGSLPVKPMLEHSQHIGATLGEEARAQGLNASKIGLMMVVLFMGAYYLAPGLIAGIAVLFNLLVLFAFMVVMGSALTLPGIAGIILTVGMAVDANVLVFERIREELKRGLALRQAVAAGYERAFVTVLDSNLTTLITAFILYEVGSGPVKGFAVSLSFGILASFFTALYFTRFIISGLIDRGLIKKMMMLSILPKTPNITFTRFMNAAFILSLSAIVFSIGKATSLGERNLGIDFTGGCRVQMNFQNEQSVDDVRTKINHEVLTPAAGFKYPGDAVVQVASVDHNVSDRSYTFLVSSKNGKDDGAEGLERLEDALRQSFGEQLAPSAWPEQELLPVQNYAEVVIELFEPMARQAMHARLGQAAAQSPELGRAQVIPYRISEADRDTTWTIRVPGVSNLRLEKSLRTALQGDNGQALIKFQDLRLDSQDAEAGTETLLAQFARAYRPEDLENEIRSLSQFKEVSVEASPQQPGAMLITVPQARSQDLQKALKNPNVFGFRFTNPYLRSRVASQVYGTRARLVTNRSQDDVEVDLADQGLILREWFPGEGGLVEVVIEQEDGRPGAIGLETLRGKIVEGVGEELAEPFPQSTLIGPNVAGQIKKDALSAMLVALLAIVCYVALRFELRFGIAAVIALFHDVLITIGVLSLTRTTIDLTVVAALLTVVGYSLNDTIVVFDRIRENMERFKGELNLKNMIDLSVNQMLSRTILTSVTTFIVVLILLIWGGVGIHGFALTLITGVVIGTYSSIFVASPLLLFWEKGIKKTLQAKKQDELVRTTVTE